MNKIKYFVFSDVHGEYDALMQSLQEAGYESDNPQHQLISIGDAFDRGPHSKKIYNFLRQNNAICVKGNHDGFFEEYLEKGMDGEFVLFNILHNGLGDTIHSFTGLDNKLFDVKTVDRARVNVDPNVLSWLRKMPLYYETEHFIFCHAGLDPNLPDWHDTDKEYMIWDIKDSHLPINSTRKIVMIGHHHAFRVKQNAEQVGLKPAKLENIRVRETDPTNGNVSDTPIKFYGNTDEHSPYCYGNKIAIDGCVNLTKKVNVVVFEDYPKYEPEKEVSKKPAPEDSPQSAHVNSFTVNYGDGRIYTTTDAFGITMGDLAEAMNQTFNTVYTTTTRQR